MHDSHADSSRYKVVVSEDGQYSIWPAHQDNASGWQDAGKQGSRVECLAFIEECWTDMRTKRLRQMMDAPQPDAVPQPAPQHEASLSPVE